jgi:thiol:disulfide interchange protein DsbD
VILDRNVSASARLSRRAILTFLPLLLGIPFLSGAQGPELLEPEKAFRISTQVLDERNVEVHFQIADGYYMYRDRFRFESARGRLLADVEFPKGKVKQDPFFGKTETYRREVRIRVPVSAQDAARGRVKLKVTSQGCADVGVCYMPLEQFVDVRLSGGSSPAPAAVLPPASSRIDSLPKALRKGTTAVPQGGFR